MKKNLAILLEFGFHEIKKFIHSGFVEELAKEFNIVWLALDKGNEVFDTYLKNTKFPVIYFNENDFQQAPTNLENINQSIRRSWIVNKNLGLFHNYKTVRQKNLKTQLIGNHFFKIIVEKITLKQQHYDSIIADELMKHNIDKLLFTGYNSAFGKHVISSAVKLKIDVYFQVNSWKDLYTNNFLPTKNVKYIFVWNEEMMQQYLYHMPYLKKNTFIQSGNTTFDVLIDFKPNQFRTYYVEKYQLSEAAEWFYYTMMPPGIVNDEIETILFIAKNMYLRYGNSKQILIRRNPNQSKTEFCDIELPENVRLTDQYCEYDSNSGMLIQSKEGENEWLDLLFYSQLNLSVPSTVTLEFLQLNKKVFNIEFNSKNEIDQRLNQFFNAGFYRNLFDDKKVFRIQHLDELFDKLNTPDYSDVTQPKQKAAEIIIEHLKK